MSEIDDLSTVSAVDTESVEYLNKAELNKQKILYNKKIVFRNSLISRKALVFYIVVGIDIIIMALGIFMNEKWLDIAGLMAGWTGSATTAGGLWLFSNYKDKQLGTAYPTSIITQRTTQQQETTITADSQQPIIVAKPKGI